MELFPSVTSVAGPRNHYEMGTNKWVSIEPEEPEEPNESMEATKPLEREDDYHHHPEHFDPLDDDNSFDIMDESNLPTKDEGSFRDIDLNIPQLATSNLNEETLKKYKSSWRDFLIFANIQDDNEPTKEDFESYFKTKYQNGISYGTLRPCHNFTVMTNNLR